MTSVRASGLGPGIDENRPRNEAVDIARGLAVIGVVFNHAISGIVDAGLVSVDSVAVIVNDLLYTFRMPALATLLGLLVPLAVTRRGGASLLRSRVTFFGYLYLLWFYLQVAVVVLAGSTANHPIGFDRLLRPWIPIGQLWFLPFLLVATALLVVVHPWDSRIRAALTLAVVVPLAVLTWGWNPAVAGLRGIALMLFVAAGALVGLPRAAKWMSGDVRSWVALLVIGAGTTAWLYNAGVVSATGESSDPTIWLSIRSVAAGVCGTIALVAVAALLARGPALLSVPLSSIGRRTLPIFLAHFIVVAAVRVGARMLELENTLIVGFASVTLGVLLPLAAASWARNRSWARWLFEPPAWLMRRAVGSSR